MVLAVVLGWISLAIPGALLVGAGGALIVLRPARRAAAGGGPRGGDGDGASSEAEEREALQAVTDVLASLPVRPELTRRPGVELALTLERLQDLLSDGREQREELAQLKREIEDGDKVIRTLARELGDEPADPTTVAARRLEDRLREAEATRAEAISAGREMERIDRERRRLATEFDDVHAERTALAERIERVARREGPGSSDLTVGDRIEALELAKRLDGELRREYPDWSDLLERIRRFESTHSGGPVAAAELASRKARASELAVRVEDLTGRLEALKKDMEYLSREETVGTIDGEIESVRMEIDDAVRNRDRLWLVAALLREADRRFRDEHQPDILRRAGCHLSVITGGRYERILLDEADGARFLLDGPGYPGPIEVGEPISTGAREQVYLALRLAILDHLDRRGERLPLFMDEAFVNWDPARRERAFGLLDEISGTRQVFVFTCHQDMARSLAARGARTLVLEARE
jgi:uncharacterized protein YhaN